MDNFLKKSVIPAAVFTTGACVLIIEIIAIRILAPYFGNTIFTVSSVISVVLAALSIGYYVGGKLADKYPRESIFFYIISISGTIIIILHFLGLIFLPLFGYSLSVIYGPVISAVLLFFFQNFLLGMLSPFAVKLQKLHLENLGVGETAGQIFFWSTLGSIFGSLSAGFFLIPHFGIDKIILSIGFLLIVIGLLANVKIKLSAKILFGAVIIFSSLALYTNSLNLSLAKTVFNKDSLYQKILVYDGTYQGQPARFLQQDRNSSAAEFLNSNQLAYEYTKYYVLYQLFNKDIKNALMIGGGAYSVPKDLLANLPEIKVDIAEIDPMIFQVAKDYFNVPSDNPRFQNFAQDGRRFLYDTNNKYDFIFSDAYASFFSTPEHLTTQEFFELAKSKLSDNGVFIANVVGSLPQKPVSFVLSEMKTLKSVFPNSYFFAVVSKDSTKPQNIIFVAYNGDQKIDFSSKEILQNKNPIISGLQEHQIDTSKIHFDNYPILTDNYAPVDYMISKEFINLK